mmetsp:Transcript_2869/g.10070  ORF Transcript_2869/g.10070 Transcript_2869/m.10070 type:complete len:564 (+) Transcript_2869:222-1913(+)
MDLGGFDPGGLRLSQFSQAEANELQESLARDIRLDADEEWIVLNEAPNHTFVLPDLQEFPPQFRDYARSKLVCHECMDALTTRVPPVINWDQGLSRLTALRAEGHGSCLLHAASLGMWGVHDSNRLLQQALHHTLAKTKFGRVKEQLFARWARAMQHSHAVTQITDLQREWTRVLEHADPASQATIADMHYSTHVKLYVFVLAHILRRPIIVYAEKIQRERMTLQPVTLIKEAERVDGIYVPLLWPAAKCRKDPLALGYHQERFSPLVATSATSAQKQPQADWDPLSVLGLAGDDDMDLADSARLELEMALQTQVAELAGGGEQLAESYLPLVESTREALPVHFLMPEEEQRRGQLLQEFLTVSQRSGVFVAVQKAITPPGLVSTLIQNYLARAQEEFAREAMEDGILRAPSMSLTSPLRSQGPCKARCGFAAAEGLGGHCHSCFARSSPTPGAPMDISADQTMTDLLSSPLAATSPVPAPAAKTVESAPRQFCIAACGFYGSEAQDGYCSLCYEKYHKNNAAPAPQYPPGYGPCKGGCGHVGTEKMKGFCSKCYLNFVLGRF